MEAGSTRITDWGNSTTCAREVVVPSRKIRENPASIRGNPCPPSHHAPLQRGSERRVRSQSCAPARNATVTVRRRHRCTVARMSPTVHSEDGFRFSFWTNENREPPHVHVRKGGAVAKWWLHPVRASYSHGFNPSQQGRIRDILESNRSAILERWHDTFRQPPQI